MTEKNEQHLLDLIDEMGGKGYFAAQLDVTTVAVDQWLSAGALPPARAIQVERLTDGKFKAVDLV